MRNILVCQKCDFFIENHLAPSIRKMHDSRTLYDMDWIKKYQPYFRRRHCCRYDDFENIECFTEFYKMPVPSECPYAMEHEIYSWNIENKDVDYDITKYFKSKRTCQHCGREIPNKKHCNNCGYNWFKVYTLYNDTALIIQFVIVTLLALYALVNYFFFGG